LYASHTQTLPWESTLMLVGLVTIGSEAKSSTLKPSVTVIADKAFWGRRF
jgi:hypothetical protein